MDVEALRRMLETLQASSGSSRPQGEGISESRLCTFCQKEEPASEKFSKCGGCKEARYCSKDCQVKHWPTHKAVCKAKQANDKLVGELTSPDFPRDQDTFMKRFRPALSVLLHAVLGKQRLRSHVLSVTAQHQPGKKPLFQITEVEVLKVADLTEWSNELHQQALDMMAQADTMEAKLDTKFGVAVMFWQSGKVLHYRIYPLGLVNGAKIYWSDKQLIEMINTDSVPKSIS